MGKIIPDQNEQTINVIDKVVYNQTKPIAKTIAENTDYYCVNLFVQWKTQEIVTKNIQFIRIVGKLVYEKWLQSFTKWDDKIY